MEATPPEHSTGRPGVNLPGDLGGPEHHMAHGLQDKGGHPGGGLPLRQAPLHLIFHSGQGEGQPVQLHGKGRDPLRLPGQGAESLPRREIQPQQHPCPVNQLTGGDVLAPAQDLRPDAGPLRLHQKELRGPAGQVPGQKGPVQQVHPPGGPGGRRQMSLLVGVGEKGDAQHMGQPLPLGGAGQEAGHIGALHRPGAGAGPHGNDLILVQPPLPQLTEQLGQALDMLKQGVALAQAQLPGPHHQETSHMDPLPSVIDGQGGGVIAGVQTQDGRDHCSASRDSSFFSGRGRGVRELRPGKGAQDAVQKGHHVLGLIALGDLHRLVDGGGVGDVRHV